MPDSAILALPMVVGFVMGEEEGKLSCHLLLSSRNYVTPNIYTVIILLVESLSNYYMKSITNLKILYLFTSLLGIDIDACMYVCE